ncbi:hypothetical protein C9J41_15120 [Photobacterium sp. GB-50]|uniref:hypothetical protein n=1 Tax=unclassified Photobacterium TaxID=2628852 RepID=UPI000D150B8C|nr:MULTISPECIES: hypothetical protein [unclassified Photobacterium]PSV41033.1 hypothetical protein C9J38_03075 [Photobacterium sp. GB-210]PSW72602.1 hypothetical protein C9J41_15120 [Photobacterium sp. GB-50]
MFKSKELNLLLEEELIKGNQIAENSSWPPKCESLIILNNRFAKEYDCGNLVYREIKDSHYWHAEYSTIDDSECLACK